MTKAAYIRDVLELREEIAAEEAARLAELRARRAANAAGFKRRAMMARGELQAAA